MPTDDMLRTFNCGLGMVVVVAAEDAERVSAALAAQARVVVRVGIIEPAPTSEADCVVDQAEAYGEAEKLVS